MTGTLPTPFIRDIQAAVVAHYGLTLSDMTSAVRCRSIARPRQIAMYLCRQMTPRSQPEIGKLFGGRDHTTVLHALNVVRRLMATDPETREDVEAIVAAIREVVATRPAVAA